LPSGDFLSISKRSSTAALLLKFVSDCPLGQPGAKHFAQGHLDPVDGLWVRLVSLAI